MSRMLHMEDYVEQVPFSLLLYRWESDLIKWWQWWCQWWWWWCWWWGQPSGLRRMAALLLWLISRLTDGKRNLGVDDMPAMMIMIMTIFMASSWSLWIMYNLDYTDICCVWVECRCFPNKIKMLGSFSDVIILYCVCSYWKLISSTIQERKIRAEELEKVLGKMLSLQVGESISDISYYNIPGRKAWRKNRNGCGIYKIFRLPWS